METLTETAKGNTFIKHVFNFDSDSKADLLNIIQYSGLALIPIVSLNKLMQVYVPEASDEKGSIELSVEIIMQVVLIFLGMFFIHRLITYVPTYSGTKYADFSVPNIILGVLVIILSLQTKLGEKVSILYDRLAELWNGKPANKKNQKNQSSSAVKVTQPISNNQNAVNQSLYGGTPINQLPASQTLPNFNEMYKASDSNPLINASTPGDGMDPNGGVMAANEVLGGSSMFGSLF
jgi:hypothetical protein